MKPIYSLLALGLAALACNQTQLPPLTPTETATAVPTETAIPATATVEPSSTPTITLDITETPAVQSSEIVDEVDPAASEQVARFESHAGNIQRDVTYCTVAGVALKMDVYSPKDTSGPTPLAVFIHGGGWSRGGKLARELVLDGPGLLDAGITVASLEYRLAPDYVFPAMIEDVKCAIRSLRAHAADYQIDPDHIGVWGTSAGGHLVNLLGTTDSSAGFDVGEYPEQTSRVQAVVDLFGPADLTPHFSPAYEEVRPTVFGSFDPLLASPINYISPDDPPFLILQGDADNVVPLNQSQLFYDQLTAAGVETQLVVVQGGNHGFTRPNQTPTRDEITETIVAFFVSHLK